MEKGTSNGTATDVNGNYRLRVRRNAVLVVSYIGYLTQEVAVGNQTTVNITLRLNPKMLKEVEVVGIGYGEIKKTDATGSVTAISAKDFAKGKTHTLNQINFGIYVPKCGDYRVKSRRGGHHVDVFLSWNQDTKEGYVIGGNVSDKVSIRKVTLKSMIADGTTHITDVTGYYDYSLPEDGFSSWLKKYGSVRVHGTK